MSKLMIRDRVIKRKLLRTVGLLLSVTHAGVVV